MPTRNIAIFNSSDDTVEMIRQMLLSRGYAGVDGHADDVKSGKLDLLMFMATHKPDAMIWDIAPPYDRNWTFFKLLRTTTALVDCPLVLTTTNKQRLDELVGGDSGALEIVGKPYDLDLIVDSVVRAVEQRMAQVATSRADNL